MARNTINVGVDTERFAMALEVIAKYAAACAADLRALTDLHAEPPSGAEERSDVPR